MDYGNYHMHSGWPCLDYGNYRRLELLIRKKIINDIPYKGLLSCFYWWKAWQFFFVSIQTRNSSVRAIYEKKITKKCFFFFEKKSAWPRIELRRHLSLPNVLISFIIAIIAIIKNIIIVNIVYYRLLSYWKV